MARLPSHRLVEALLLSTLAVASSHCSSSSFSGAGRTAPGGLNESADGNSSGAFSEDLGGEDGGGTGASGTQRRDTFSVAASNKVDVVMVVDTSRSMDDEKTAIEQNMQKFVDGLVAAGLDAQISVIGKKTAVTDPQNLGLTFVFPTNLPTDRFVLIDQYIHSTDALGHLNRFFAGAIPTTLPLRAGVPVEVAIISDDNGSNVNNNPYNVPKNTAAEFTPPVGKKVTINAIVGNAQGESPINANCEIENAGTEHITLQTQTGGTYLDLCEPDWSKLLKAFTDKIVVRNSGYKLNFPPDSSKLIEVRVNDKVVDAGSYKVDDVNLTLSFASTYTIPSAAKIAVFYYVK